jgi:hypothetical protein
VALCVEHDGVDGRVVWERPSVRVGESPTNAHVAEIVRRLTLEVGGRIAFPLELDPTWMTGTTDVTSRDAFDTQLMMVPVALRDAA